MFAGIPSLCAGLCFPSGTLHIGICNILNFFKNYFGTTSISPWTHKQPLQRLKSLSWQSYVTFLCWSVARSSFLYLCLPSVGVACSALLFFLLEVRFMFPCASQSLRLWGCFRNKSFYHPIAVVFNYPLLDGEVYKHKQKGFQQFSQCLNVWTILCASCSIFCHPSNSCLSHFQYSFALCWTLSSDDVWVC